MSLTYYKQMKKPYRLSIIVLCLFALVMIVMPDHVLRALMFRLPDLDDYKIFHNRTVAAGEHQPWDISETYNTVQLSDEVTERMMSYDPVAFLVIRDRQIVHETYWDGYDENSFSNSFSVAKSMVGLLIGAAIDDGFIQSIDQQVADFLPVFQTGNKMDITIRHLLTMSSGLN